MVQLSLSPELIGHAKRVRGAYLAALGAPRQDRDALLALVALEGELSRIPELVSEPMLGRVRLQWWLDAFKGLHEGGEAVARHPVLSALLQMRADTDHLARLVECHNFTLDEGPADADAFAEHARERGAAMGRLMMAVLGVDGVEARHAAREVGAARVLADALGGGHPRLSPADAPAVRRYSVNCLANARAALLDQSTRRRLLPILMQAPLVERCLRAIDGDGVANRGEVLGPGAVLRVWWGSIRGRY